MNRNNTLVSPEITLIPVLRNFGEKYFGKQFRVASLSSEIEISADLGVADIVFFNFNRKIINERKRKKISPIKSNGIIKTLMLIKNKKRISITYLVNKLFCSESDLKNNILRYLERQDILKKIGNDCYEKKYNYKIGLDNIVAIEAKIKDWKRGLYQAYHYKLFANASYLALHRNYTRQAKKNINLFKKLNVGLISVTEKCVEEILYSPTKEKPQSRYMTAVVFEKLLKKNFIKRKSLPKI